MLFIRFFHLFVNFTLVFVPGLPADSTLVHSRKFNANLSGTILHLSNWKGESFESYSILSGADYYMTKTTGMRQYILMGKSELGYTHILDSLWNKQADLFNWQFLVKSKQKTLSYSWSMLIHSQFLNSYKFEMDANQQALKRKWTGTFLNPATLEVGYGMNVLFWKKSMLNLAIASARLRSDPVTNWETEPAGGVVGKINRGWLLFDYGVSGQLMIVKYISKELEWNSNGKVFLKGFSKKEVRFDISNSMSYKFWKYVEMRADLKLVYDPLISFRMQYRNELLFGFVFKYEK